jgi:branched-chain amino acid transport system substrate-binding protein
MQSSPPIPVIPATAWRGIVWNIFCRSAEGGKGQTWPLKKAGRDFPLCIPTRIVQEFPMMKRSLSLRAALLVLGMAGVSLTSVRAQEKEPIHIAAIYNLTGAQAPLDGPSSRGAKLAIDQAQKNGGILGRPLQLLLEDGQSDPEVIARKTKELLEAHPALPGIIGLSDTEMVLAAAPLTATSGRLFLTSGATSPQLPVQVPHFLYLACFGDNVQAAAAAEWAYNVLGAREASILYDSSRTYARLLQGYFDVRFRELGGKIRIVQSYVPGALESITEGVDQSDIIFLAAGPSEVVEAIEKLRKAGVTAPILGGDSFDFEGIQDHADVYFTTHADLSEENNDPAVKEFREAYEAAYPGEKATAFAALGYDAAQLYLHVLRMEPSMQPAEVIKALESVTDFRGVTGLLSYGPERAVPLKSVTLMKVEEGKRRGIRQFRPEKVPAP